MEHQASILTSDIESVNKAVFAHHFEYQSRWSLSHSRRLTLFKIFTHWNGQVRRRQIRTACLCLSVLSWLLCTLSSLLLLFSCTGSFAKSQSEFSLAAMLVDNDSTCPIGQNTLYNVQLGQTVWNTPQKLGSMMAWRRPSAWCVVTYRKKDLNKTLKGSVRHFIYRTF